MKTNSNYVLIVVQLFAVVFYLKVVNVLSLCSKYIRMLFLIMSFSQRVWISEQNLQQNGQKYLFR